MQEMKEFPSVDRHIHIAYDTHCGFCQRTRIFVEQRMQRFVCTFSHTDSDETITVHTPEGVSLYKYKACMYVLRRLDSPWRILGYVGALIPAPVGDIGYNLVARNRKLL